MNFMLKTFYYPVPKVIIDFILISIKNIKGEIEECKKLLSQNVDVNHADKEGHKFIK